MSTSSPSHESALQVLLPHGIRAIGLSSTGSPPCAAASAGASIELSRRRLEHAAGRRCADAAVECLGIVSGTIGSRRDGRPSWPQGVTGSITHTDGFAAAAVGERAHYRAIGIDAERIGEVSRELWSRIFVDHETRWLHSLRGSDQARAATSMFSAKEAFYKCQYEVTGEWLEFRDIELQLFCGNPTRGRFVVRPTRRAGWFERVIGPALIRFSAQRDLALTAMTLEV